MYLECGKELVQQEGYTCKNLEVWAGAPRAVRCAWSPGCGWEVLQVGGGEPPEVIHLVAKSEGPFLPPEGTGACHAGLGNAEGFKASSAVLRVAFWENYFGGREEGRWKGNCTGSQGQLESQAGSRQSLRSPS